MKIARAKYQNETFYCLLEDGIVRPLSGATYNGVCPDDRSIPLKDVALLAPSEPTKIVAVGLNYKSHAGELDMKLPDEPVLFIKPASSVLDPFGSIAYPAGSKRVDFEAELAVVIGKTCRNVFESEAKDYILGYTCINDVTARDIQEKDGQWTRAKGFDTFCPMGPHIETEYDWRSKRVRSILNGRVMQDGNTAHMIFGVEKLVSFISAVMTLLPGDVIATGTPAGIGPMRSGDTIEIVLEGIGTLENTIKT